MPSIDIILRSVFDNKGAQDTLGFLRAVQAEASSLASSRELADITDIVPDPERIRGFQVELQNLSRTLITYAQSAAVAGNTQETLAFAKQAQEVQKLASSFNILTKTTKESVLAQISGKAGYDTVIGSLQGVAKWHENVAAGALKAGDATTAFAHIQDSKVAASLTKEIES